jgi:alanine or glycine:cation symporter, AGCS family
VLYVVFALTILYANLDLLPYAFTLIFKHAFTTCAATGGFVGASAYAAMSSGIYRGIYITEAGIGTSSIPHALADVKRASDQGVLAMFSVVADATLSIVSGLLVIVTGVWCKTQIFTTAVIYHVFKAESPILGKYVLIASIMLLVFTTILGNSFNGTQIFINFFKYKGVKVYYILLGIIIFLGSIAHVRLMWDIMDVILALVAIPNLIGIVILSIKYGSWLRE